MNLDQGYNEIPYENIIDTTFNQLDDLPNDYFYSLDYNYLTLPEVQLLILLSDSQISYSFSGLRKTTALHQQRLSKTLKRLQDRGFLSKTQNGTYEMTNLGSKRTRDLIQELLNNKIVKEKNDSFYINRKIIRTIPPCDKEFLVANFERRWFGKYRFLYSKNNNETVELCWEDNADNRIHMYINKDGKINVELKSLKPNFSDIEYITKWITEEISNEQEVEYEIEDINDKIPYN